MKFYAGSIVVVYKICFVLNTSYIIRKYDLSEKNIHFSFQPQIKDQTVLGVDFNDFFQLQFTPMKEMREFTW